MSEEISKNSQKAFLGTWSGESLIGQRLIDRKKYVQREDQFNEHVAERELESNKDTFIETESLCG